MAEGTLDWLHGEQALCKRSGGHSVAIRPNRASSTWEARNEPLCASAHPFCQLLVYLLLERLDRSHARATDSIELLL